MSHANGFDVTGVATDWLNERGITCVERVALLREVEDGVKYNPKMRQLLIHVAERAAQQRLDPVNTIALALTYGQAIGVLLERSRKKELVL